jgi:hypothetical protein
MVAEVEPGESLLGLTRSAVWPDRLIDRLALTLVALQAVLLFWLIRPGYWFVDDFAYLAGARWARLTPGYLRRPFFDHLLPGPRLLNWILIRVAPMDYAVAAAPDPHRAAQPGGPRRPVVPHPRLFGSACVGAPVHDRQRDKHRGRSGPLEDGHGRRLRPTHRDPPTSRPRPDPDRREHRRNLSVPPPNRTPHRTVGN